MVEARIMRLPGYVPVRGAGSDGASEGSGFLWRLGDALELFEDQGDVLADTHDEDQVTTGAQQGREPAAQPDHLARLRHKAVGPFYSVWPCNPWMVHLHPISSMDVSVHADWFNCTKPFCYSILGATSPA